MAIRILSKSILRRNPVAPCGVLSPALRHRSSQPGKLTEIDLESSPSTSSSSDGEIDVIKMRKLEEAIHALFVEKSTPDWLPFIPGSSFWVPPRKPRVDVGDIVDRLWSPAKDEEEDLRFASGRGWPVIEFFSSKDVLPETLVEFEVEVKVIKEDGTEVNLLNGAESNSESEDTDA